MVEISFCNLSHLNLIPVIFLVNDRSDRPLLQALRDFVSNSVRAQNRGDDDDDEGAVATGNASAKTYSANDSGEDHNKFGDDMLQMVLKMETGKLTPNTIQTPQLPPANVHKNAKNDGNDYSLILHLLCLVEE